MEEHLLYTEQYCMNDFAANSVVDLHTDMSWTQVWKARNSNLHALLAVPAKMSILELGPTIFQPISGIV